MKLPDTYKNKTEWVIAGPMGSVLPESFSNLPVMAIDGGARHISRMDIWVGDADSYKEPINSPHIFKLPVDKDLSDLAAALNLFQEPRHYKFHLWGFLGGRRDHELFNLGETFAFLERHQECQVMFYNEEGNLTYYMVGAGHWKFNHVGTFSLGTLKKTEVRLTGHCKYQISSFGPLKPLSSYGLSNCGEGEIHLETEGPVFVYFPEEA